MMDGSPRIDDAVMRRLDWELCLCFGLFVNCHRASCVQLSTINIGQMAVDHFNNFDYLMQPGVMLQVEMSTGLHKIPVSAECPFSHCDRQMRCVLCVYPGVQI